MTTNSKLKAGQYDNQDGRVSGAGGSGVDADLVVVGDGSGNLLKAVDNGDGTATLAVSNTPSGTQNTNIVQVASTAVDTNSGAKSAGTLRVVLATDQPALTAALKVDGSAVTQPVSSAATTAANVLNGFQSFTATTAATTLVTVPATRTWVGTVSVACAVQNAAAASTAGQARAVITTAGTNVTPAAGTVFAVEAKCGANAATGTVGSQGQAHLNQPLTVIAPAGNSVTIQVTTTVAGTAGVVDATATGALQ